MKGFPKYSRGQLVSFTFTNVRYPEPVTKVGRVYIIDAFGTFDDPDDVSYDILVENEEENCLYKHVTEALVQAAEED